MRGRKKDKIDALIEDVFPIESFADSIDSYYQGDDADGVHDAIKVFVARAVQTERDRIIDALHSRAGVCLICRRKKCPHSGTELPVRLDTEIVLAAINNLPKSKPLPDECPECGARMMVNGELRWCSARCGQ